MELKSFEENVSIHQTLGDNPNTDNALSAEDIKAKFDLAAEMIKRYLNDQVVPAVNSKIDTLLVPVAIDPTFTKAGYAADAKAVGDSLKTDSTLSLSGKAADAAATGTALAGKAPAGFGLGEASNMQTLVNWSGINDVAVKPGWYKVAFSLNGISNWALRVDTDGTNIFQEYKGIYNGVELVMHRSKTDGVWSELEWVNPPMILGVEYRTTERWNGKPVYVQAVNLNALPAGSLKFVYPATPIAPTAKLVDLFGTVHYSGGNMKPLCKENRLDVTISIGDNTWRLDLTATADLSAHTGTATLKYCKE